MLDLSKAEMDVGNSGNANVLIGDRADVKLSVSDGVAVVLGPGDLKISDGGIGGTLTVEGGASLTEFGTAEIGTSGRFVVSEALAGGQVINVGTGGELRLVDGFVTADAINVKGAVLGTGTLDVDPANRIGLGGVIAPGLSPGELTIDGGAVFEASNVLQIEIGGLAAGIDYDVLNITGDALLGGVLEFIFIDDFLPSQGDVFEFLNVGGILSGDFDRIVLQGLGPNWGFEVSAGDGGLVLGNLSNVGFAVPEPPAGLLLAIGFLGILFGRKPAAKNHE